MQTLRWRAPEILFGDDKFDFSVDVWSLGLVFCELAGSRFHMGHANKAQYLKALCGQLGSPDGTAVAKLSGYPAAGIPSTGRKPWPASFFTMVGSSGYELLDKMLQWDPISRIHPHDIYRHEYLVASGLRLFGDEAKQPGKRHDWNILSGHMEHDVLLWLRADPALSAAGLKRLELSFDMKDKRVKTEAGRKIIIAGYSYTRPPSKQMCCLSLAEPLPMPRFEAWAKAFRHFNADSLAAMSARALKAAAGLGPEDMGQNVPDFVGTPLLEWFGTCGEMCLSAETNKDVATCWPEAKHQDGGSSVVHVGVALFGRCDLVCDRGGGLPPLVVRCTPGQVDLGGFTGPEHQVHHQVPLPG